VINLAKDIFEFNGWSSAIRSIENGFVDEFARTGKVSMCLSVTVRRVVHTMKTWDTDISKITRARLENEYQAIL